MSIYHALLIKQNECMKSISKQNSKLRIHSKPDRNQSELTVCIVCFCSRKHNAIAMLKHISTYRSEKEQARSAHENRTASKATPKGPCC